MADRKHFLIFLFVLVFGTASAQNNSFAQADSTTQALYNARDWKALITYGNRVFSEGLDYPSFHQRVGYAQFMSGNYSAALKQYEQVLKNDSSNPTARYLSMLCEKFLNRSANASYHASFIDTGSLNREHITAFGLVEAGVELGIKVPGTSLRGNGIYTRASLANRLGWRLQLDESVAYFGQNITSTIASPEVGVQRKTFSDNQFEYYARLNYTLGSELSLIGAYHYLHTSFGVDTYENHVGLAGLKLALPYLTLQADANLSRITNANTRQYNGELTVYPLGNLNLYTTSRISVQSGSISQTIFAQRLGFKVAKNLWAEGAITLGRIDNYLENDALYVYNAIDVTKFKTGGTLFYQAGMHALWYLNYTFEQKEDHYINNTYQQNSITGGFTWKF